MPLLKPVPPPYDIGEWQKKPFPERVKMVCKSWALQGYGAPWPIYLVYILKGVFYIAAWGFFCSFTEGLGDFRSFSSWYYHPVAFQKAVLWSMAFEGLGLGCGSGPLTGRYKPPFGGPIYFAVLERSKLRFSQVSPSSAGQSEPCSMCSYTWPTSSSCSER